MARPSRVRALFALLSVLLVASMAAGCRRRASGWPPSMRTAAPETAGKLVTDAKGDVVLFVLYASWCSGCRAELPDVDRMGKTYGSKGLRIVALALDDDPVDYDEMLRQYAPRFDLVRVSPLDNAALRASLQTVGSGWERSLPYGAVFDRSGRLAHEWKDGAKPAEMESAIRSLL